MKNYLKHPAVFFVLGILSTTLAIQCDSTTDWMESCRTASFTETTGMEIDASQAALKNQSYVDMFSSVAATAGTPITRGGRIHRCVLAGVLKSLGTGDEFVNYAFGVDSGRTFLIIQGGNNNPDPSGAARTERFMVRTGMDAVSFCPNQCDIGF